MKKSWIFPVPFVLTLAGLVPAQNATIPIRAQVEPGETAMFLLALDAGPPVHIPGVRGVLRLDLRTLFVVGVPPPNAEGISSLSMPVPGGFPEDRLHVQILRIDGTNMRLDRRAQPLVDRHIDALERSLSLGQNVGGLFLFDLSSQQIVDTVHYYLGANVDPEPVLLRMRRPMDRVTCGDLHEEVGLEGSCRALRETWRLALARRPQAQIDTATDAQLDALADQHFHTLYPNGVPEDDEYWDGAGSCPTDSCEYDYSYSDFAQWRLCSQSRLCKFSIKKTARGRTEKYIKVGSSYSAYDADYVNVHAVFTRDGSSTSQSDYEYSDWKVQVSTTWWSTNKRSTSVASDGTGYFGTLVLSANSYEYRYF